MNGSGVTGSSASRISVTVGVVMTSKLRAPPRAINACARYGRTSRLRSFCAFCSTHFNGPRAQDLGRASAVPPSTARRASGDDPAHP